MREIKFRGKSVDDGKWYYGLPYFSKDRMKSQIRYDISERGCTFVDVIPKTISEFTGLKDKNGVEIYEDDVVEVKYKEWREEYQCYAEYQWEEIEQIVFNDSAFMLKAEIDDILFYRPLMKNFQGIELIGLEVIGNIYESKELLDKDVEE